VVSANQTLQFLLAGYDPNALRCRQLSWHELSQIEVLRAAIA
jgi:hypothetical protein